MSNNDVIRKLLELRDQIEHMGPIVPTKGSDDCLDVYEYMMGEGELDTEDLALIEALEAEWIEFYEAA